MKGGFGCNCLEDGASFNRGWSSFRRKAICSVLGTVKCKDVMDRKIPASSWMCYRCLKGNECTRFKLRSIWMESIVKSWRLNRSIKRVIMVNEMEVWQNSLKKSTSLEYAVKCQGRVVRRKWWHVPGCREVKMKNEKCLVGLETWSQHHLGALFHVRIKGIS